MRSVSKPRRSDCFSRRLRVKKPGLLVSIPLMTFSSEPLRPRSGPKMAKRSVPPRPFPRSSASLMKNISVPHSSSMTPRVARRLPVMYPMQSLGMSMTVQSSRSRQPMTYTGPSNCWKSHFMYSLARLRSTRVPEQSTTMPTYCTTEPDDRSSFRRVPPCFPRAYEISPSSRNVMKSVPQVPVLSLYLSLLMMSSWIALKYPGDFVSTALRTFSSEPLRARMSPKMTKRCARERSVSMNIMRVPHSSSMLRRTVLFWPCT
mmetsp:Transcript_85875/g.247848  ORF Transcript_85875/g.247848 Transcript_85875/m.247848 type:complete len:260 (+) Transcript_85875:470-1249(+)